MIRGMTGFGRAAGQAAWGGWAWEARSVNGKSLDVRMAGPPGYDAVEFEAKKRVREKFQRGSVQLQLRVDANKSASALSVDLRELNRLARLARRHAGPGLSSSSVADLMQTPGVIQGAARAVTTIDDAMVKELIAGLDQALEALDGARRREGETLMGLFVSMLDQIADGVGRAQVLAVNQPQLVGDRFRARLAELAKDVELDPDRVVQEAAVLATKADVREELDRLVAHVATARELVASPEAAGRKLDFLCQEFNREANTLCSKSASLELTNVGLGLKSVIDQFREQAQNVE
jgi:uncharacterized protein (TIGR00255 family)